MNDERESIAAVMWRRFWKFAGGEDREVVTSFVQTGTVPRARFEERCETHNGRGFLSKRILKSLLEPMGLWRLFKPSEAQELYRRQPEIVFAYQVGRRSFFGPPPVVHKILLRLRPVYLDYSTDGGPRIDLHGY